MAFFDGLAIFFYILGGSTIVLLIVFWSYLLFVRIVKLYRVRHVVVGDPLFLTPFIRRGEISLAKEFSIVRNLYPSLGSYSGFMTVNESTNANMFFWFFPAQKSHSNAPVLLWCPGGPGRSGLHSLFINKGPYEVDHKLKLKLRKISLNLEYNIIFIDYPIGTGFSFSDNETGFLKSSTDPEQMYDFLTQFYAMFPEYLANDFYVGGGSFGGIFAPTIAHKIHMENLKASSVQINLKGVILDCPWSDPVRQLNYGEFLYNIGLLDRYGREHVSRQTKLIESHINAGRWTDAYDIYNSMLFGNTSYLFKDAGMNRGVLYNFSRFGQKSQTVANYVRFVEQSFARNALHVGNLKFTSHHVESQRLFEDKGLKSVKPFLETLLSANKGYRVLIYAGQMDVITNHLGIQDMIQALEWPGADQFRQTKAQPWTVNGCDYPIGFVASGQNLTYLFFRNVGHCEMGEYDSYAVSMFTKNLPFTSQP